MLSVKGRFFFIIISTQDWSTITRHIVVKKKEKDEKNIGKLKEHKDKRYLVTPAGMWLAYWKIFFWFLRSLDCWKMHFPKPEKYYMTNKSKTNSTMNHIKGTFENFFFRKTGFMERTGKITPIYLDHRSKWNILLARNSMT